MTSPMLAFHIPLKQVTRHACAKLCVCATQLCSLNKSTVKIHISTADEISKRLDRVVGTETCN